MKKIVWLFFLFFSFQAHAQILPVNQLKEDFDSLRNALEEAHAGLYRFSSKSETDRRFNRFRKRLKEPMSQHEFYGFLSEVVAGIRDGHLRLDYDEADMASRPAPLLFPFRVLIEGSRMTVLSNDTKTDSTIRPGMQILSINGRSITDISRAILPKLRADGYIETGKKRRLERSFSQNYFLFSDPTSTFVIRAKDSTGRIVKTSIKGVPNPEREANRNQNPVNEPVLSLTKQLEGAPDNLSLRFVTDSVASLRIRLFVGEQFTKEIDSIFALLNERQTKVLILDLRGNGGGLDHLGAHLISKFMDKPFRYLDRIHARVLIPSFADWKQKPPVDLINGTEKDPNGGYLLKPQLNSSLAEQLPSPRPFTGKLIVLIDGITFSTASDVSALLRHLTKAVFVGEESGGTYEGNTSALHAIRKLPHSKFNARIHLWELWNAVPAPKNKGRGTMPDYPVERKAADWLRGNDTQWEFALKLSERKAILGEGFGRLAPKHRPKFSNSKLGDGLRQYADF